MSSFAGFAGATSAPSSSSTTATTGGSPPTSSAWSTTTRRAEDVAQDVFVSALRRMRDTDRPIAFKPWIYEIAKNACIDQFRRSRRAEEVSYDAEEGLGAADYGRLVSADAIPEAELESKQAIDHLRGAFGGLSETHHEILVMRELEGLSYREIGERLGMTPAVGRVAPSSAPAAG